MSSKSDSDNADASGSSNGNAKKKPPSSLLDNEFADHVKDSAQQIWQAGLGAFSKAQAEGSKVFDALVKDGMGLQQKSQAAAEEKLAEMSGRLSGVAGEVQAKAGQQWDKLESIFEERTARALGRLGVPSAKDIEALTARIEALSEQVAKLSQDTVATRKEAAKAAAKPAAKKAPAKRAARKRSA